MWSAIQSVLKQIDDFVWGVPLMVLILSGGLLLTVRLGLLQVRKLGLALKWMVQNEEEGEGEISSFAALCTALSATIGTGNIVGVATAVCAGGPGALFWMIVAAFLGMATKYSEGLLAVNIVSLMRVVIVLEDHFIILKKEWEKTGSGLLRFSRSLVHVLDFLVSEHSVRSMVSLVQL